MDFEKSKYQHILWFSASDILIAYGIFSQCECHVICEWNYCILFYYSINPCYDWMELVGWTYRYHWHHWTCCFSSGRCGLCWTSNWFKVWCWKVIFLSQICESCFRCLRPWVRRSNRSQLGKRSFNRMKIQILNLSCWLCRNWLSLLEL